MVRGAAAGTRVRGPKARMLTFRYVAHAGRNRVVKGTVRAVSEVAGQHLLVERGYTPVSLDPIPSPLSLEGALPTLFGIKSAQIITFSRQLATLLESGVSLLPALQLLESQVSSGQAFGRVVRSIAQDLGTGKSFAQAIARHSTVFSEIYVRTLSVGERTGKLEAVLRQMADYMEKQAAFAKKVSGALRYPAIVGVVGISVAAVLVTVVLPKLTELFRVMKVELPLTTRMLLAFSDFVNSYTTYLLAAFAVVVVFLFWAVRQPRGRLVMHRLRLNAPVIGPATRLAELARVCRTMSVLLSAGLSLQEVIELLPQTTSNSVVRAALQRVRQGLLLGQGLTHPMSANTFFPPLMLQMVRVGEESNTLEKNLAVLADFYEANADERTAAMLAILQPASILLIGAMGLFIALSVVTPMYGLTKAIG